MPLDPNALKLSAEAKHGLGNFEAAYNDMQSSLEEQTNAVHRHRKDLVKTYRDIAVPEREQTKGVDLPTLEYLQVNLEHTTELRSIALALANKGDFEQAYKVAHVALDVLEDAKEACWKNIADEYQEFSRTHEEQWMQEKP
ncbi:MAG: hypothetical protein AAB489_04595 [Patescibacteria group bacterium]